MPPAAPLYRKKLSLAWEPRAGLADYPTPDAPLSPALFALRAAVRALRCRDELNPSTVPTAQQDPLLHQSLLDWLLSGELPFCQVEESAEGVTLTLLQAVRFHRAAHSGELTLARNRAWVELETAPSGDFDADFARLTRLAAPQWQAYRPGEKGEEWNEGWPWARHRFTSASALLAPLLRMVLTFLCKLIQLPPAPGTAAFDLLVLWPFAYEPTAGWLLPYFETAVSPYRRWLDQLDHALTCRLMDPVVQALMKAYVPDDTLDRPATTYNPFALNLTPAYSNWALYHQLARHRDAAAQRLREAPHLAPVALRFSHSTSGPHYPLLESVLAPPRPSPVVDPFAPASLAHLKCVLLGRGLSESGWRWLTRQPPDVLALLEPRSPERFLALANYCARFRLQPPAPFLHQVLRYVQRQFVDVPWPFPGATAPVEPPRYVEVRAHLFRALATEAARCQAQGQLPAFLDTTLDLVLDWLHDLPPADRLRLPTKQLTFAGLDRRQREWHEAELQKKALTQTSWLCLFDSPQALSEDVLAVPLTTSTELWLEGQQQHHCVASYAHRCAAGHTRIYSLRTPQGPTLATLELAHDADGDSWSLGQLRGPHNRAVAPALLTLAQRFVERFQRTWRTLPLVQRQAWAPAPDVPTGMVVDFEVRGFAGPLRAAHAGIPDFLYERAR